MTDIQAIPPGLSQHIRLPLPPSVNCYWRKSPRGMFITKQGKDFRREVAEIVAERQCLKFGAARLFMAVRLCMRDRRKSDLDNRLKALADALEHAGVFDNDEQIDELLILRGPIVKGGECYVMLSVRETAAEPPQGALEAV
ncbi:MAG TPA: RusA family crossover junction endodeoxyribonuclease [Terriglobales bacterium]|nr:RusA family crossover junction endodeoxyribonuclease [Terriglobales bacterium]